MGRALRPGEEVDWTAPHEKTTRKTKRRAMAPPPDDPRPVMAGKSGKGIPRPRGASKKH